MKMDTLKTIVKFARLRVTVMLWALVFIGSASGGDITEKTLLALPLLTSWYIHATTTNDYSDYAIDTVNLKTATDRPLLNARLPLSKLWTIHVISAAVVLGFSFFYGIAAFVLTLVILGIDYVYSLRPIRISDRGIAAQGILAFAYVYYPLSIGYWAAGGTQFPWLLSVGIFIAFVARLLLKDFRDIQGDRKYGKRTFLVRHGAKTTVCFSAVLWLLAAILLGIKITLPGFLLVVFFGMVEVILLLRVLYRSQSQAGQQTAITFIAKTANAIIITLLAVLLSLNQPMLSNMEILLIPSVIGLLLLVFNWIRYLDYRKTFTVPHSAFISTS